LSRSSNSGHWGLLSPILAALLLVGCGGGERVGDGKEGDDCRRTADCRAPLICCPDDRCSPNLDCLEGGSIPYIDGTAGDADTDTDSDTAS